VTKAHPVECATGALSSIFHQRLVPLLSDRAIIVRVKPSTSPSRSLSGRRRASAQTPRRAARRSPFSRLSRSAELRAWRWRVGPSVARSGAALVCSAWLCLLAAGCGESEASHVARLGATTAPRPSLSSPPSASAQVSEAIAFSQCMRSHGVLSYPDPSSGGALVKESLQQLGVSLSRFQAAASACRQFSPNGPSGPNPAAAAQVRAQALSFSQCVRSHGVTNFPDPASDGRIPDPATLGINQGSPKFEAANDACRAYRPPYMPSNAAYDAWARTHGG